MSGPKSPPVDSANGASSDHARCGATSFRSVVWPAAVAYVTALLLVVGASEGVMLLVGIVRAAGRSEQLASEALRFTRTASGVMVSAFVSATVFSAVAFVAARFECRDVMARLGLRRSRASRVGLLAAVVGMMGLSFASGAATDLVGVSHEGTMNVVAQALVRPSPRTFVLAVASLALGPAVAEEMLFRGYIQARLAASWRPGPSILVTAASFGLIHLDAAQGAVAILAGTYLGWLARRFGGIRPGIAAHAVNNAAFVAAASLGSGDRGTPWLDAAVVAVGGVACAAAWAVVRSPHGVRAA